VFSNEVGVVCQCHEKVWKIKKVDERFVISHQPQNNVINIASPALAYLDRKYYRSQDRQSIG
jgi:hypothetical protein